MRYWLSRTRTTLGQLLIMGMLSFAAVELYRGFVKEMPPVARLVCNCVQIAAACVAFVRGWIRQRREHREALLDPPTPEETWAVKRAHNRRAPRIALSGRGGLIILAAPIAPAFLAYYDGWIAAWLTVREYPSEVGARRWLEEQRAAGLKARAPR
ncbi:hypothetical protein PV682_32480 [Streptomyces niveiscabiei]|uniref:hypothetical protein n=1 Tax=Streptomyces niveiscabiei TaxID=164115 RepID=UPI0029A8627E|nr:hypothetical protein [Streptomyces niveiscabiei]MDX3386139.1 hypothetical protein [Streptomyces niveiscabiei]